MSEQNVEIVRQIWEAWGRGETDAVLHLYDEDLVWDVSGMGVVGQDRYTGVGGARQQRREWAEAFGDLQIEAEDFADVGNSVVVRVRHAGEGTRSGAPAAMTYWQVWRVRHGKVVHVGIYVEEAKALEAADSEIDEAGGQPFVHTHRVRYLECDMQGVVAHPNYLGFFDWAMTEMWRETIGPYQEMVDSGVDLVIAETSQRYHSPARFDELLDIAVSVRHIGNTSLVLGFEATVDGRAVCSGENRYVAVATGSHEKIPIPDHIRAGLERYRVSS